MKYDLYTTEDFLTDESFVNYCLRNNEEDTRFWEDLLMLHPHLSAPASKAEELFFKLSVRVSPKEKQQELEKLKSIIENATLAPPLIALLPVAEGRSKRLLGRPAWFSIAASLLICIGVYTMINRNNHPVAETQTIPLFQENNNYTEVKTGFNERKSIKLPDGSSVLLNGYTTLKIDKNYNSDRRILWVDGEADFNVAKDRTKPFMVISGKVVTTALGTSFKVKNYSGEQTSVMLSTGKVSIGTLVNQKVQDHLQLLPGEKVEVPETADKFIKSTFDLQEMENWTERRLVFSRASLQEIRTVLKDIYGVEIISKNQPKKPIAFTGQFNNQGLTEVLDAIGFSNHFTYTIDQEKVILKFDKK